MMGAIKFFEQVLSELSLCEELTVI